MKMYSFQAAIVVCGCVLLHATADDVVESSRCHGEDPSSSWLCCKKDKQQETIDHNQRPCNNFYKYVCDTFGDSKGDKMEQYLKKELNKKIIRILQENVLLPTLHESTKESTGEQEAMSVTTLGKKVYKACLLDAERKEKKKYKEILLQLLKEVGIDSWPLTGPAPKKTCSEILGETGLRPVSTLRAVTDEQRERYVLTMNIPYYRFSLYPHVMKDIENPKHTEKYRKYKALICDVLLLLRDRTNALRPEEGDKGTRHFVNCDRIDGLSRVINDILDVEKHLAKIAHESTVKTKHETHSIKMWESILGETLPLLRGLARDFKRAKITIESHDDVHIHNIDYFKSLAEYLISLEARKLLNYIGWFAAREVADVLTANIRRKLNEFLETIPKPTVAVEFDQNICIDKLIGNYGAMEKGVAYLYLREFFNSASVKKASSIAPFLRASFYNVIENNSWMDKTSRVTATKWNNDLIYLIGAPLHLLNETYIAHQYDLVKIPKLDYLLSYIFYLRENNFLQNLRQNNKPYKRGYLWPESSLDVRSRYSEHYTALQIPAAALQAPIFAHDKPTSHVFGSMVTLAAETLAYGLLDEGRVWNDYREGKYRWERNSMRTFKQRVKCLKRRRKNEDREDAQIPSEELSDTGASAMLALKAYDHIGLRTAFMAFKQLLAEWKEKCPELKNNEEHNLQAFFISYAMRHCVSDPGKEEEHRVNFQLKTYEEFWSAFKCQPNDPMREKDECRIVT